MSSENLKDLTVIQLKDRLKALQLRTTGSKVELLARLMEVTDEMQGAVGAVHESSTVDVQKREDSDAQRQINLLRREKEVAERELEIARREIEMMRQFQQLNMTQTVSSEPPVIPEVRNRSQDRQKISISAIADLLSEFDGSGSVYDRWEKQVKLLKTTYNLSQDNCKILIGSRLKGKALEWFHSKPEYIEMRLEEFLAELRGMFHREMSKATRRKQFEERLWRKGELFSEYFHQKVILGNSVPIDEDEIIDYLIAGIPDVNLRDQAYIQRFQTKASLLEAFEKVSWRGKVGTFLENKNSDKKPDRKEDSGRESAKEENSVVRRCRSCGSKEHLLWDCPTKDKGVKCFACREYGHVASKCPKSQALPKESNAAQRLSVSKRYKEVSIDGHTALALIDTGSNLSLLGAEKYIQIGAPRLVRKEISFNGIGSKNNRTLGKFTASVTIDKEVYPIEFHVVSDRLMSHELLIGTDFLHRVNVTINEGKISIVKPDIKPGINVPKILKIDCVHEVGRIDVSYIVDKDDRITIEQAEREAKLERQRLKEEERLEDERLRAEEEQRRLEEETFSLANEVREAEEQRLRLAIEETKRREEEDRKRRERKKMQSEKQERKQKDNELKWLNGLRKKKKKDLLDVNASKQLCLGLEKKSIYLRRAYDVVK